MAMKVELLCWVKEKYHDGNRDTADDVVTLSGETCNAKLSALMADGGEIPAGFVPAYSSITPKIAVGHGVTVRYPNGALKTFRAE